MYQLSDYNYYLPDRLIAQFPAQQRDRSRLMVLNRSGEQIEDRQFQDITDYLGNQDLLVVNNVKVDPIRLFGRKENMSGREVEVFLLKKLADGNYEALLKPAKKVPPSTKIFFDTDRYLEVEAIDQQSGHRFIRFAPGVDEDGLIQKFGQVPIPPYIKKYRQEFVERYQTVYAKQSGASAAPTAGMHFTDELLEKLKAKGVQIVELTLYVGVGTFEPIRVEDIRQHQMHREKYAIDPESWQQIKQARASGKKIVCVGTTSMRTLEAVARSGQLESETDIFIYPGFEFQMVDKLITNFHLPKSSLLMLVSAFAGFDRTRKAYHYAVKNSYRFFSFGDAMLIE
jgi:S-adenosylmethionine:tRNA ribosyltransferase-isomerase